MEISFSWNSVAARVTATLAVAKSPLHSSTPASGFECYGLVSSISLPFICFLDCTRAGQAINCERFLGHNGHQST
jgi:hypothetical protein